MSLKEHENSEAARIIWIFNYKNVSSKWNDQYIYIHTERKKNFKQEFIINTAHKHYIEIYVFMDATRMSHNNK